MATRKVFLFKFLFKILSDKIILFKTYTKSLWQFTVQAYSLLNFIWDWLSNSENISLKHKNCIFNQGVLDLRRRVHFTKKRQKSVTGFSLPCTNFSSISWFLFRFYWTLANCMRSTQFYGFLRHCFHFSALFKKISLLCSN